MKLIRNPYPWGCLLASMAMVLEKSIQELIWEVGHDGSEIVFPQLPEPAKRRGFHIQEFISTILKSGFAVTAIESLPCSTPDGKHEYSINFPWNEKRFWGLTVGNKGILTGLRTKWRHAVAWNGVKVFDPLGSIYRIPDIQNFSIDVFYRFDQIKSL